MLHLAEIPTAFKWKFELNYEVVSITRWPDAYSDAAGTAAGAAAGVVASAFDVGVDV